mgnify:CR=1 FL=1
MALDFSIKTTPPLSSLREGGSFLNRKSRRLLKFGKKNAQRLALFKEEQPLVFMVVCTFVMMGGQLWMFPYTAIATPTDLDKFTPTTRKEICKRACKLGYNMCDSWWKLYRGRKTPGRLLTCAVDTVAAPVGWIGSFIALGFGGLEAGGFVLATSLEVSNWVHRLIDKTESEDAAACGCAEKVLESESWWSWFISFFIGKNDK